MGLGVDLAEGPGNERRRTDRLKYEHEPGLAWPAYAHANFQRLKSHNLLYERKALRLIDRQPDKLAQTETETETQTPIQMQI